MGPPIIVPRDSSSSLLMIAAETNGADLTCRPSALPVVTLTLSPIENFDGGGAGGPGGGVGGGGGGMSEVMVKGMAFDVTPLPFTIYTLYVARLACDMGIAQGGLRKRQGGTMADGTWKTKVPLSEGTINGIMPSPKTTTFRDVKPEPITVMDFPTPPPEGEREKIATDDGWDEPLVTLKFKPFELIPAALRTLTE